MIAKTEIIELNGKEFIFQRFNAFESIKQFANIQNELLKPILEHFNINISNGTIEQADVSNISIPSLIIGISQALDGDTIEKWVNVAIKSKNISYSPEIGGQPNIIRSIDDLENALEGDAVSMLEVIVRFFIFNFEPLAKQAANRFSGLIQQKKAK